MAAFSVTRTSSSARLRSGALGGTVISEACSATLLTGGIVSHSLRSFYPDQVEAARHHRLRRTAQAEPEGLHVALQHAVLGVKAVEVVGDANRVGRNRMRSAPLRRLGGDPGELQQAADEALLLVGELGRRKAADRCSTRLPEDPCDPCMDVLDVVDGVLRRLLLGQVD